MKEKSDNIFLSIYEIRRINVRSVIKEQAVSHGELTEKTNKARSFWAKRIPVRGKITNTIGYEVAREFEQIFGLAEHYLDQDPRFLAILQTMSLPLDTREQ